MTSPTTPDPSPARREVRVYLGLAALALVLVGADVAILSRAEAQPASSPVATETAPAPSAAPAEAPPAAAADPALAVHAPEEGASQACAFAANVEPVEAWQSLIDVREPVFGNRDAKVTVIEFFEPNCPHCAQLMPAMQAAEQKYGKQARFIYKPVVFWPRSTLQAQALYAAGQESPQKFHALMALQMQRQKPEGFNESEVRALAREAGMNADALMERINGGVYRAQILAYRDAFARSGSSTVPFVLINGRPVGENRTAACLGQLIQQAAGG